MNKNGYAETRMMICRSCPLCKQTEDGLICNPNLWLNPKNGIVSAKPAPGSVNGCNCILEDKVEEGSESCPAGKW